MRDINTITKRITVTGSGVHVAGFDGTFKRQRTLNLAKIPETLYMVCGLNAYRAR